MATVQKIFEYLVDKYHGGVRTSAQTAYGISRTQLHAILSGDQANPGFKTLARILEVHPELDANWLLTGTGSPEKMPVAEELEKLRKENQEMRNDIRAILKTQKKYL